MVKLKKVVQLMKPNTDTTIESLLAKTKTLPNGCMEWQASRDRGGYGYYMIMYKNLRAHRVMAKLLFGSPKDGLVVMHSCDNPPCINPEHLSYGTQKQNVTDKFLRNRGNVPMGESHTFAKLSDALVRQLRDEYKSSPNYSAIARNHGISVGSCRDAILGKTWKHIPLSDI